MGDVRTTELAPFLKNYELSSSLEEVIIAAGGNVCGREREKLQEFEKQNELLKSARRYCEHQMAKLKEVVSEHQATIKAKTDYIKERDNKISELEEAIQRLEHSLDEQCRDASHMCRRYALFVHYNLKHGRDWQRSARGLTIDHDVLIPRLDQDIRYLHNLLSPAVDDWGREWEGFTFLLIDPGWTELLIHKGDFIQAARLGVDLHKAKSAIQSKLSRLNTPTNRVRLVSAADLIDLVALLKKATNSEVFEQRYDRDPSEFLTGGGTQLLYDGAKVIEGANRIGNIGRQIPIMRFDDDVIFYGSRSEKDATKIAKETQCHIIRLCERYRDYSVDPGVDCFAFSGAYVQQ